MNKEIIKQSKWAFLLKAVIGSVFMVILLFFIISIFETEQRVNSLNSFLSKEYVYFLLFRLVIYGGVVFMCLKMKPKIKSTAYYNTFVRTCFACIAFVSFNEVMLYIRLMG